MLMCKSTLKRRERAVINKVLFENTVKSRISAPLLTNTNFLPNISPPDYKPPKNVIKNAYKDIFINKSD